MLMASRASGQTWIRGQLLPPEKVGMTANHVWSSSPPYFDSDPGGGGSDSSYSEVVSAPIFTRLWLKTP